MLYLDLIIYLNSLNIYNPIIIYQINLIILEILSFFYINEITKTTRLRVAFIK